MNNDITFQQIKQHFVEATAESVKKSVAKFDFAGVRQSFGMK